MGSRIDLPVRHRPYAVAELARNAAWHVMLEYDQLITSTNSPEVQDDFVEPPIRFPPTIGKRLAWYNRSRPTRHESLLYGHAAVCLCVIDRL